MARNASPKKRSGKAGKKAGSRAENRVIVLALGGFTALVLLAMVGLVALNTADTGTGNAGSFTPNDAGLIQPGSNAPDFTTETVDGGSVSLGGDGKSATMLVFFATWCPHCQAEAPAIRGFERKYDGLRILWVSVADKSWPETDTPEDVRRFMDEYGIQSPAAYDPALGRKYKVTGTPTVYVLDGSGKVVGAHSGEAPKEAYERWIRKALGSGG